MSYYIEYWGDWGQKSSPVVDPAGIHHDLYDTIEGCREAIQRAIGSTDPALRWRPDAEQREESGDVEGWNYPEDHELGAGGYMIVESGGE